MTLTPPVEPPQPAVEAPPPRRAGFLWDTLVLGVIAGVAKLAGAVKSIAIARVFGSGSVLDAYLLAFLIPSVIADTFCGALVPVTVPRLIELEHRSGREATLALYARLLRRSVQYSLLGAALLGLSIGAWLEFSSGSSHPRLVGALAVLMLPVIPCNAIANVWRAVLNAQNKFAAPALTVVFTPLAISAAVLAAGSGSSAWILAGATTAGATGELVLLGLVMRSSGFPILPWRTRSRFQLSPLRGFRNEYLYLAASGAVSGGTVALGQAMAAWAGPGGVSALNYGTRLSTVLMSIGPAALSVAVLPWLSRIATQLDRNALRQSLRKLLWGAMAASAAAAALFILFSQPIVRLTLQRGAFTAADTQTVAAVQSWSLLQMPFMVGISILMRVYSILQANRLLLPLATGSMALALGLGYVLMTRQGVAGIALAMSVSQALLFAAMAGLIFAPGSRFFKEQR